MPMELSLEVSIKMESKSKGISSFYMAINTLEIA